MKLRFVFYFAVIFFSAATAGSGQTLTVVIKNIKNSKGDVGAALYTSEAGFMKTVWKTKSMKAHPGEVRLTFENIPAGTYAISIMHDLNSNGEMDTNGVGIPKEGFGFSNDAMGSFGPPTFEKASLHLTGKDEVVTITAKYF
jgi:uncharacterized protein (DUF2141 family)